MSRSNDPPVGVLDVARYIVAAMVLYGALSTLLAWQREGWHSAFSPIAQIAEAVACVLVLWRPRAGLLALTVPMGLTLWFGTLDADILAHLLVPGTFAAVARPRAAVGVVGLFLGYAVTRSLQVGQWEVAAGYLALLIPSASAGLLLRATLIARRRGQGRMQVMGEDARRVRDEERARLAAELRTLVSARLADSRAVLAAASRLSDPEQMRAAIARVNEACLGALVGVRALVGILREDQTGGGHDEAIAPPGVTAAAARLREGLEEHGIRVSAEVPAEADLATRVTQSTVIRVMDEIADAVISGATAGAEVTVKVEQRRGWVSLDALYPAAPGSMGSHEGRMDRLRQRAETLGGSLSCDVRGGFRHLHLTLPPALDPPTAGRGGVRATRRLRRITAGTAKGLLTMALTIGGLGAGAGLGERMAAGEIPGESLWEVAGFIASGLLLWWPVVGALPAAAVTIGLLFTSHSDDLALAALLIVACWQASRVTQRWAALALGLFVSGALVVTTVAGVGAVREQALAAAVILFVLPPLIAARHFLVTRRTQMAEMEGLRRTTEGIRTEERNLLARELHDVVAHHLSVATLQSMAYGESDSPVELRTALTRMERSTTGADHEMELLCRIMAGQAGEETGIALVRPTTVVGVLAETLRDNGFRVSVSVDPLSDGLPALTLRTLTRVMQECVTNILRYGQRDGACRLALDVGPHEVTLRIVNAMPPRRRSSPLSLGYGLAGIRERVDLLAGRFEVSAEGDTWVVEVVLPTEG